MKSLRPLLQNPNTYIESADKHDRQHVADALRECGADTVLRVCLWRNY
jgi:hypothetical protein